ncbi:MAG: glycosyltransferase family 1 protein [Terracidiphilus sp.]|jgi:glycosyltransferase involved in cell wall biosynthesis
MRILYDHQVFSLQDQGGISRYHFELARHLSQRSNVNINVYLGFNQCPYPFRSLEPFGAHILGWNVHMSPGLARYALNETVTSVLNLTTKRWDIYHPTYYRRMPWVRSQRTVATNHDCTPERFPELFPKPQRVIREKRDLYASADAIICVSESSRSDLLKYYNVDREKTHVVYLGVTRLERDEAQARNLIERLRRPYILYVGARYAYKNFDGLLRAYGLGGFEKEYDLVVVGGGKFTETELGEIRRLGISDCVLHWGFVTEPELAEAYSRAHLFVIPSFYEGFGLPPLEAMSMSCPVLASFTSSIPEVCGDAALYFDPANSGDLDRGLRDALNDPDRQQHIAMGIERAACFNWQTTAEKTLELYGGL